MIASEIEAFLDSVILERGQSRNTSDSYGRDLRFFAEFLKGRKILSASQITREDIVDFLASEREQGLKGSTRARRTAAIRMWLRYLKERHLIAHDPSELMDSQKKSLVLPRVLSEAEVFALLDAIQDQDPRSLRDRALLEILYGCGLRVSEACDLKLEDVVSNGELLRVLGKGSKERIVPIGAAAGKALTAYLALGRLSFVRGDLGETHVFVTRLGRQFTRRGVFKIVKERATAVGIAPDRISPHVLRHCFASHMLSHGADIRAIQELLGHADIGTTQVYTHVDVSRFSEIHKKCHPRAIHE